ncbi:MAG: tandem-95 repeat protein [Acidobacteria bacterium]|nr:tandem-95 repeat protein [Acidobacteriota bacterium]MYI95494.1 tandem-95 repeat protein [Acidobacteriota bacterium]
MEVLNCGLPRLSRAGILRYCLLFPLAGVLASPAHGQTPGLVLWPTSTLVPLEGEIDRSYTVKLATQPTDTVKVAITGWSGTDLTLDKTSLTFTTENWNDIQTVTVSAAWDVDQVDDTVTLVNTASGGGYDGVTASVPVRVNDNSNRYYIWLNYSIISVDEDAGTVTQTVRLNKQPSADVTVTLSVADKTVATVDKDSLTFTPSDYNSPQTVTITGVDDAVYNPSHRRTTVALTASGAEYIGVTEEVPVYAINDEPQPVTLPEGAATELRIGLTIRQGDSPLVVNMASSDTDVLTISPTSLTWTAETSGDVQSFTITAAENDAVGDGQALITLTPDKPFPIFLAGYDVTVTDNDTAAVVVDSTSLTVAEGSNASYTVRLARQPSAPVTVAITGTTGTDLTLDERSLTFNPSGSDLWSTARTVTVSAGEDDDSSNDTATLLHTASGGGYDSARTESVAVTVTDDDEAAIVVDSTSLTVPEGGSRSYTVRLATQPSAPVTVAITGAAGTDLTLNETTLTFNPSGSDLWSAARTVTVSAGEDDDASNDLATLLHMASGGDYADETASLSVTTDDDETVGIVLTPASSLTVSEGGSNTYTVRLATQPSAPVTVAITGTSGTDLTLDETSLTFNPSGSDLWSAARTITVSAGEDEDRVNDAATLLHAASGGDYAGESASLAVTVTDNDTIPPQEVSLSVTPNPVDEGQSLTVAAMLSGTLPSGVTVPLTLTAGTAESGDYGTLAGITIAAGGTTGTGTVSTAEDADRDDETFTVALGDLPEGLVPGSPSSVEVTIRDGTPPPNRPPTVTASCAPCVLGPGGTASLTATASDPDGDPLTFGWSAARGGFSGPVDASTATWTAPTDLGRFAILVEVSDGRGGSASASVEVEVANSGPEFGQASYRFLLPENLDGRRRPVELGTVTAEDADGDEVRYSIVFGDSERFTVGLRDGVVRYVGPGEDYETEPNLFELTVRVRDDFGADDAAKVFIEVTDENERPGVTATCEPCAVPRGGAVRLTATATDPDGDPLTYAWSAPRGRLSDAGEPVARWTAPDELGTTAIRVEVSDGRGGTASAVVEVEVFNLAPAFGQPVYEFELPENVDGRENPAVLGAVAAEDPDGDALTYELVAGDRDRFAVGARDGVVTYIGPGEDYETEPNLFELTVRVRDDFGEDDDARVVVTVTDVNELPEVAASCDPCAVPRGGEVWLEARATDPDGDPLAYGWSAAKGRFNGSVNASWTVWKAPDELGTMTIRVEVSDGRGGRASAEVEVEVVNRAPAFGQPLYLFLLPENVDGRESPADLDRVAALDPDGDALTYEIVSGDRRRFAVGALDGMVRYVGPGEDFETEPNRFELVVRAFDGFGGEARTEVEVEVTDVNEAPEAADDEVVTPEDQAVTVDVLANDTDPEGDRLHVRSITAAAHGTTRLVSGGIVMYTPERDFHGADAFTYVASDGRGLRDTATVAVTVLPVNDAPTAVGRVPDQTLDEGGGPVQVDLSPYFGDVDGDALTYGARSNDSGVVEAAVAGTLLTLTPVVYGSATVTVTAWDPAGLTATQSVRVGVSDRPQRTVLGNMLAATARGHLASLRAALGRRMAASPCEASRLAVMGRSVPLGRTEAADMLRGIGTGARSAAAAALRMGEEALDPFGAMRLQAGRGATATLGTNTVPETAERIEAALRAVPGRALGGGGGGSGAGAADFLFGWGGSEQDGGRCPARGRWSLWGQGDVQRFEGTPSTDSGYGGELSTAYVGLDTRMGARWLAGLAVSRSKGVGDWRAGTSDGRLTQFMTAVHPYLRWDGASTSVWASVGAGRGNAYNVRTAGRTGTSPTDLRLGLVELEQRLGAPGGLDFAFLGDAAWARLRTGDGDETIDRQDIAVNQVRIGLDLSLPARIGGLQLTPSATVHARRDGGAGQTGDGVEVAGGLRAVLGFVRLDAQARALAHHTAEGYGESGAAVTLALGKHGSEEGFSLSVSPRWGGPARASGALLHGPLGGGLRSGGPDPQGWTLDARASYGVSLPGGLWLDLHGDYGAARGGPGFRLSVERPASTAKKSEG